MSTYDESWDMLIFIRDASEFKMSVKEITIDENEILKCRGWLYVIDRRQEHDMYWKTKNKCSKD